MQQLATILEHHPAVKYVDVSANNIKSRGLKPLVHLLCCEQPLEVFRCRKNDIQGEEVIGIFKNLISKSSVRVIDLKDNFLINENAEELVLLARQDYHIEELCLDGNRGISSSVVDEVAS